MNLFLAGVIVINLLVIGYVSQRLYRLFHSKMMTLIPTLIAVIFIATHLFGFNTIIGLSWLSAYGYGLLLCAFFIHFIMDIGMLLTRIASRFRLSMPVKRTGYLIALFALFATGVYSALIPKTTHYNIHLNKASNLEKLRIVQLTDIHINEYTGRRYIERLVERTNALQPDLVVITGDTLDNQLKPYLDQNLAPLFAQLNAKYGVVAVFGNHEYYGIARMPDNSMSDVLGAFKAGQLVMLQDSRWQLPNSNIVIIGRDDYAAYLIGKQRESLDSLLKNINTQHDITILLDHQPYNLAEAANANIDIMFSGHTHGGQIFPGTLIVNKMYQNPVGLYQQQRESGQTFSSIVSQGYGLWGPPIRLMTRAEIVVADITFNSAN